MKLFLIALVLAVSLIGSKTDNVRPNYGTGCLYNSVEEELTCEGYQKLVECHATLTWRGRLSSNFFGLGLFENDESRFRILPRSVDNTAWERGVERQVYGSLYTSENSGYMGLRVTDKQCYDRIAKLLRDSSRREQVMVNGELTPVTLVADLGVESVTRVERMAEELEDFKKRADAEWDLVERNTQTLVDELNTMKRELNNLKTEMNDKRHSTMENKWTEKRHMDGEKYMMNEEVMFDEDREKRGKFSSENFDTEDFVAFKKRADAEWDLVERNTQTLVDELNTMKRELYTLRTEMNEVRDMDHEKSHWTNKV